MGPGIQASEGSSDEPLGRLFLGGNSFTAATVRVPAGRPPSFLPFPEQLIMLIHSTIKKYFTDPSLEGHATVVAIANDEQDGRSFVLLDMTWFHAQGGGQLSDHGYLGDCRVTDVRH